MAGVAICPTNFCNFDCFFCAYRKSKDKQKISTISVNKVKKMLDEANPRKFDELVITGGGEPLLAFNKVLEIIKCAKKRGFRVKLVTNGFFGGLNNAEELVKKLKSAGLYKIIFSVDYDHLRFINYPAIPNAIKFCLDYNIIVGIRSVSRRKTYKKNIIIFKKIAKDLKGTLIKFYPSHLRRFLIISPYFKKLIFITDMDVGKSDVTPNSIDKEIKTINLSKLIFDRCKGKNLCIDANSVVVPCSCFYAFNNLDLYPADYSKSPILSQILNGKLAFVKLYIKIKNDVDLKNKISKENFYDICDFCFWILKHKDQIEKIKEPSKFQLVPIMVPLLFYKIKFLLHNFISLELLDFFMGGMEILFNFIGKYV